MTAITLAAAPRPRADLVAVELDGETVVYAPDGTLHKLDAVATTAWRLLDGSPLSALVDDLATAYPTTDRAVIARDVLGYVERLAELGLLDPASLPLSQPSADGPATHDR